MPARRWRALVDGLFLELQFRPALDDEVVDFVARYLIAEPVLDLAIEEEYALLDEAVRSGERVTDLVDEAQSLDFLRRLLHRMDELRPWPEPAFRTLPTSRWSDFSGTEPIAQIHAFEVDVENRLRNVFRGVEGADHELLVMVLRLRSGDEVALATPWWPGTEDPALFARDAERGRSAVVAAFCEATGIDPDVVAAPPSN